MKRFDGKTALVTGGGTGIGLATARRLTEEGAFVFIAGRRQAVLDQAVAGLGPNARAVQADVSKIADLERLFELVRAERGTLDILVANAGGGELAAIGDITEAHFDRTFGVNVKGTVFTVQKALPLMTAGGSVVLIGSTAGIQGEPAFSIYSASKAAVRSLARGWAQDLRGTGVRINVLSPGPTLTEGITNALGEEAVDALAAATPLGRIGDPSETAAAVAFLVSDESSFMTGSELFVDGGYAQI